MSWLDRLFGRTPQPAYWQDLYLLEKKRADELFYKFTACETEKSKVLSDFNSAQQNIRELRSLKSSEIAGLERQIRLNSESYLETIESLRSDNGRFQTDILVLQDKLKNQTSLEITPDVLKYWLLSKYGEHSENPKLWDVYDKVLFDIFGVEQPVLVEVTAADFKARIEKAYPGIQFHSPAKDSLYYLPTESWTFKALVHDFGNLMLYVPEKKDCDAFAQALRSHFTTQYGTKAVVELWGYWITVYHSWNCIVCSDGILEVEPQTDQVYEAGFLPDHKADSIHDW